MGFDPTQYKTTTRQQWEDAAEAWHRWGPTLETWLGAATERMLDGAGVTSGSEVLDVAFTGAGFTDVRVDAVPSPLELPSAAECVRFERESFGALHQMLAGVDEGDRPAVWDEIEAALRQFETRDGFAGPCELLVASGVK